MKESDEPAFADADDNNDEELPRRALSLFPPGDSADPLEEGEDAFAIASVRASSVVGFSVNTCTVPFALETANQRRFGWKARLYISARSVPRRSCQTPNEPMSGESAFSDPWDFRRNNLEILRGIWNTTD